MTEEALYTRIEAYLESRLSEAEVIEFEKELHTDDTLTQEVELHKQARRILDYSNYRMQKDHLTSLERQMYPVRRKLYIRLAAAAAIVIAVVAGTWAWIGNTYSDHALSEKYFAQTEPEIQRSGEEPQTFPINDQFLAAQELFNSGRYAEAAQMYSALASQDSDLRYKAEWNHVIALIASGQCNTECEAALNRIANTESHPYHQRAASLSKSRASLFHRLAN